MPYYGKAYSSYKPTGMTGPEKRRAMMKEISSSSRAYSTSRARSAPGRSRPPPLPMETKYFDTSFSQVISTAADWTGSEVPCTNYLQADGGTLGSYTDSALIPSAIGAGYGQVNGSKYFLKKLRLKGVLLGNLLADQADVPPAIPVRLLLVEDSQPQGAQAQGESILTDMGTSAQAHFSFLAMAAGSGGRFRILKDKIVTLQQGLAGTDGASTNSVVHNAATFKFNIAFRTPVQIMLKCTSAVPTVAALSNKNYFLIAHAISSANTVTISGCARAYYQD